jgi:hypothetical protein
MPAPPSAASSRKRSDQRRRPVAAVSALCLALAAAPGPGARSAVAAGKLLKHPDATLDVATDAVLTPRGTFEVTQDGVAFTIDGHQASVRHVDPPLLLGLRRLDEVTAHNPESPPAASSPPAATPTSSGSAISTAVSPARSNGPWRRVPLALLTPEAIRTAWGREDCPYFANRSKRYASCGPASPSYASCATSSENGSVYRAIRSGPASTGSNPTSRISAAATSLAR